jgi:hypothetical protein
MGMEATTPAYCIFSNTVGEGLDCGFWALRQQVQKLLVSAGALLSLRILLH